MIHSSTLCSGFEAPEMQPNLRNGMRLRQQGSGRNADNTCRIKMDIVIKVLGKVQEEIKEVRQGVKRNSAIAMALRKLEFVVLSYSLNPSTHSSAGE